MDVFSEMAYDQTPYRYGFNNPVYWSDATGMFETRQQATDFLQEIGQVRSVQFNPVYGGYTATIVGGEFDGDVYYDFSLVISTLHVDKRTGEKGGGASSSDEGGNSFLKILETGELFNVWGVMREMRIAIKSRIRSAIDASMDYDEAYERGKISILKGKNGIKRMKDALGAADSRSSLLNKLNQSKEKTVKVQYESYN